MRPRTLADNGDQVVADSNCADGDLEHPHPRDGRPARLSRMSMRSRWHVHHFNRRSARSGHFQRKVGSSCRHCAIAAPGRRNAPVAFARGVLRAGAAFRLRPTQTSRLANSNGNRHGQTLTDVEQTRCKKAAPRRPQDTFVLPVKRRLQFLFAAHPVLQKQHEQNPSLGRLQVVGHHRSGVGTGLAAADEAVVG